MCQLAVWICCIVVLEGFEGKFGVRVGQGGVAAGVHGQALGKGRMPWAHTLRTGTQHTMTKGAVILIPVWHEGHAKVGGLPVPHAHNSHQGCETTAQSCHMASLDVGCVMVEETGGGKNHFTVVDRCPPLFLMLCGSWHMVSGGGRAQGEGVGGVTHDHDNTCLFDVGDTCTGAGRCVVGGVVWRGGAKATQDCN
ncbi:hypothetical protein FIBSPDRAFT_894004 [Athelia psychrophila]|uniref:Secreted protein n=1 Tax=Athelia psychrophila TaxID=1759441 RepID=A0A166GET3_9AGAM|nr:hypothetical protein FIBSPDRAFT_894004 [Fibularhizoctonia sp. CBS 109695]